MSEDNDNVSPTEAPMNFRETLTRIVEGAKLPAKRRGENIKSHVDILTSTCYEKGVLPDELMELVDLITTPSHLDQASLNSILRNLYPATSVSSDHIVKVVGCLGHGTLKPSLAIQAGLLKWLVMIYHVIEKQNFLSQSYSVLFNLLDTAAIRPQLCHILALITRRRHVRPYRIQALLSLRRQTGNDPALTGLLRVFKDYYPEIIVGDVARRKASAFKHPDPQWRERLDEIQRDHAQSLKEGERPRDAFRVSRQSGKANGPRKTNILPEVHTSHAQENSVTLEEIENVDGLVQGLETIELPNQLVSVLADPLLQKLLLLKPNSLSRRRVNNWLVSYALDLMSGEASGELEGILDILQTYVNSTKHFPAVIWSFFEAYLKIWNGVSGKASILEILSHVSLPPQGFSGLYQTIFQPLELKVLDGTAASQLEVLKSYTALLRHWATLLLSQDDKLAVGEGAVHELANHVNKLCLTLLQTSPSTSTHSAVLDFYEELARAASNPQLLRYNRIVIPPPPLVYILHFSPSAATVSRLCGTLALYKEGFQMAMAASRSDYSLEYINEFNGFLMDICNCLWRSRAFNAKDANAHACLLPEGVAADLAAYVEALNMGVRLPSLFNLSASPTLGLLSTTYLRGLEELEIEHGSAELEMRHAGPVTKGTLVNLARNGGLDLSWDEYRLGVLEHLEQNGMAGVSVLMYNTMTTLMKRT